MGMIAPNIYLFHYFLREWRFCFTPFFFFMHTFSGKQLGCKTWDVCAIISLLATVVAKNLALAFGVTLIHTYTSTHSWTRACSFSQSVHGSSS